MRTRFVLLAAALLASACGTTPRGREDSGVFDGAAGDGARDARGDAVFAPGLCTPDPALLLRRTACRSEEHCPCGAHCELGECVATCGAAACPPDQQCDLFGRCVPAGQSLSSLGPPPVAPGVLVLRERTVDLPSADAVVTLGWRASERALGAVHAVAASGWQLQCAAGGAWATECRWPALAVGQEQLVQARAMPGSPPSQPALVSVFHAEALAAVTLRPPPVPLGTAPPGTYRGTATLVDLDVASDSAGATALPPPFALEVELDAVVFVDTTSGAGVLRLDDPTGALHPARRWWGALQLDPSTGNGTLALPAQRYLHPATEGMPAPAAAVAGLERDVLATPESASVRWDSGRRALSFLLPVRLDGVLEAGSSPRLRWRVLLAKSGELNPGLLAQPVPPPDTLGAIGRVGVASAWEGALRSLLRWRGNANLQDARDTLLTLGERVAPGGVWRFDACAASTPLSSADWARLRDELFAAGAPQSAGGASSDSARAAFNTAGLPLHAAIAGASVGATVASVTVESVDTDATEGLPCEFAPQPQPGGCGGTPASFAVVDQCAALAQRYGCVPTDVSAEGHALHAVYTLSATGGSCPLRGPGAQLYAAVRRVCRAPAPTGCAEMATCLFDDGATSTLGGARVLSLTGDLACREPQRVVGGLPQERTAATTLELRREGASPPGFATAAQQLLRDLASTHGAPPDVSSRTLPEGLALLSGQPQAFDVPRWLWALSLATENARARAQGASTEDLRSARYALRLLAQWLDAHALLASEALEREGVPSSLRAFPDASLPASEAALLASLEAWDVLLHPRYATALFGLEPAALEQPDYRAHFLASVPANAEHDAPYGLLVPLARTLTAQLELARAVQSASARAGAGVVPSSVGRALRTTLALLPLLERSHARALTAAAARGATLAWELPFQRSRGALHGALQRALTSAGMQARRRGATGVDDSDLAAYDLEPSATFSNGSLSRALLGADATSAAFAPSLLQRATAAAPAATDAWARDVARPYRASYSSMERDSRVAALRADAAAQLTSLCGTFEGSSADALVQGSPLHAERCAMHVGAAGCTLDATLLEGAFAGPALGGALCLASELLRRNAGAGAVLLPSLRARLSALRPADAAACTGFVACGAARCASCGGAPLPLSAGSLGALVALLSAADPAALASARAVCPAAAPLPMLEDLAQGALAAPSCAAGSLGQRFLAARAARADLEDAATELLERELRYDLGVQRCVRHGGLAAVWSTAQPTHAQTLTQLDSARAALELALEPARAVQRCLEFAAVATPEELLVDPTEPLSLGCGASPLGGSLAVSASSLREDPEGGPEASHARLAMLLGGAPAVQACVAEAGRELAGARIAMSRAVRVRTELDAHLARLREGLVGAHALWSAAVARSAEEALRSARGAAVDGWYEPALSRLAGASSAARRGLWLALRAQEYERQSASAQRGPVQSAAGPTELALAGAALWASAGEGTVGGAAPSVRTAVLSLRDVLLALADESGLRTAEAQPLEPAVRFRRMLQQPRFAAYDAQGRYLGQRVPFSLAPVGTLGLGDTSGVALLGSGSCGERLAGVALSVLGQGAVQGDPNALALELAQSDSFFEQLCVQRAGQTRLTAQGLRPALDLFVDPYFASASGLASAGLGASRGLAFEQRASVRTLAGADPSALAASSLLRTPALTGRGVFSRWALWIPAAQRAVDASSPGLRLELLEDVLLRVDYVGAAR